jgi:hypothetical protein
MSECHPRTTLLDSRVTISKNETDYISANVPSDFPYAAVVSCLMYAMITTQPDLAHCVSVLSRFMINPGPSHITAAKHALRYLKGTLDSGIIFGTEPLTLVGWTDSDHMGCPDTKRSTSGYVFQLAGGPIIWRASRQSISASSTYEAEYISCFDAVQELRWLAQFLPNLDIPISHPAVIKCDNASAVALSRNPAHHSRSKHFDLRHHIVQHFTSTRFVSIEHVPGEIQLADIFTKRLHGPRFIKLGYALGLRGGPFTCNTSSGGSVKELGLATR